MSAFSTTIQLIYVAAASCFVLGLHLMNTPATAPAQPASAQPAVARDGQSS